MSRGVEPRRITVWGKEEGDTAVIGGLPLALCGELLALLNSRGLDDRREDTRYCW